MLELNIDEVRVSLQTVISLYKWWKYLSITDEVFFCALPTWISQKPGEISVERQFIRPQFPVIREIYRAFCMTMRCYKYQIEVVIERIIEYCSQCYRISIDKKMGPTHIHDFLVCRADISVIVKFTTVHPEPFHIAVDPGSRSSRYTRVLFMK